MAQISRMAAEVNKLIGGSLLTQNAVYLPSIGSLYIITSPEGHKRVEFSSVEQRPSLLAVIKDRAGCTSEQAGVIYERWRSEVSRANVLLIDGVGELHNKSFITLDSFSALLNQVPQKSEVAAVEEPKRDVAPKIVTPPTAVPTKKEEKRVPIPPVVERERPKNQTKKIAKPMKTKSQQENDERGGSKIIFILILIAIIAAGSYFTYSCISKSNAEKAAMERTIRARQAEQQRIADSIAVAQIEAKRIEEQNNANEAQKNAAPKFRVAYGVFELRSNVDSAIKDINAQFGEGRAKEYPFGSYTLVTMFEANNRDECQNFLMKHYDIFPDAWIYEAKE